MWKAAFKWYPDAYGLIFWAHPLAELPAENARAPAGTYRSRAMVERILREDCIPVGGTVSLRTAKALASCEKKLLCESAR